jgi:hypothetical protein
MQYEGVGWSWQTERNPVVSQLMLRLYPVTHTHEIATKMGVWWPS